MDKNRRAINAENYDRVISFIQSLTPAGDEKLESLAKEARHSGVPIIREGMERVLASLVKIKGAKRILELGTAVGYSAIVMWLASEKSAEIVTIEKDEKRAELAEKNFKDFGCLNDIRIILGDAAEVLDSFLKEYDKGRGSCFDFVFLDAAKGQYGKYLSQIDSLIDSGSVVVVDNCLQDGAIIEPRDLICQRDRTIYDRMRHFLYDIMHSEKYMTTILPVCDGVAVAVKR